ncbi:hypothetical protein D8674_034911 [Pyrus ussuriensis x Pyrus communis]|uniref:Uncharacterized protein n=1 Tax=Pyrus ussuriensis x Pyrus communis TaxID=2448454 RepID=A0A5N5GAX7_9ROSA|nr:hypothetical protein D8674_034911 [Pyrus ussuriensis x Pyrus communis]
MALWINNLNKPTHQNLEALNSKALKRIPKNGESTLRSSSNPPSRSSPNGP